MNRQSVLENHKYKLSDNISNQRNSRPNKSEFLLKRARNNFKKHFFFGNKEKLFNFQNYFVF